MKKQFKSIKCLHSRAVTHILYKRVAIAHWFSLEPNGPRSEWDGGAGVSVTW